MVERISLLSVYRIKRIFNCQDATRTSSCFANRIIFLGVGKLRLHRVLTVQAFLTNQAAPRGSSQAVQQSARASMALPPLSASCHTPSANGSVISTESSLA